MQTPRPSIAAVILAAGASTRFGSPKQLATIGAGTTMLEAVIAAARRAGLAPIVVVLPPDLPAPAGVEVVENDRPKEGISRSLRLGIGALPRSVEGAVILLGDQPTVTQAHLAGLLRARATRPVVASADPAGLLAPPVLLEREAFRLVEQLTGDAGLRGLLRERADLVEPLVVSAHVPDVDTPADLAALAERRTDDGR